MKNKICLIMLFAMLFVCIFAVAVSAEETDAVPEWPSEVTILEGMSDKATFGADGTVGATSRVLLSNGDGTYTAYPAYYICKNSKKFEISFSEINSNAKIKELGITYSAGSLIRIEAPIGVTYSETCLRAMDGYSNLKTVVLPEGFKELGAGAFRGNSLTTATSLVSVTLPSTLETMGEWPFGYCTALKSITIPSNLKAISKNAFLYCTSLETVDFSQAINLESIGETAFKGTLLSDGIVLPENLITLGDYAFKESGVTSVYIPSSVTSVGAEAFISCTSLKNVVVKAKTVSSKMFKDCTALESVDLSAVETISARAFQYSKVGTAVPCDFIIGESLKSIGCYAFQYSGIKEVYLPSTLTIDIDTGVTENNDINIFEKCQYLTKVVCKTEIISPSMFSDCTSLQTVVLENTVKISSKAFYISNAGTSSLQSLTLPETLVTIGDYAFIRSTVPTVILPASLTTIGSDVFKGNTEIEKVVVLGSTLGKNMFSDCSNLKELVITDKFTTFTSGALSSVSKTSFTTFYTGANNDFDTIKTIASSSDRITSAKASSYADYKNGTHTQNKYIFIYGANLCDVAYGEHNIPEPTYYFTSYTEESSVKGVCTRCGIEEIKETVAPLFTCLGFSAPDDSFGGISIGFRVDHDAISAYERITSSTVSYGLFVGVYEKLGNEDVINLETGEIAEDAVVADLSEGGFVLLKLKIAGFTTDEQKASMFAVGTYVINGDNISYVQANNPTAGEKYYYTSYNNIVK